MEIHYKSIDDAADAIDSMSVSLSFGDNNYSPENWRDILTHYRRGTSKSEDGGYDEYTDSAVNLIGDFADKYRPLKEAAMSARSGMLAEMHMTRNGLRRMAKVAKDADNKSTEDVFDYFDKD